MYFVENKFQRNIEDYNGCLYKLSTFGIKCNLSNKIISYQDKCQETVNIIVTYYVDI